MALITGYLRDIADMSLFDYKPVVVFTPTTPGVDGNVVVVDRPVEVVPQSNGRFDVELRPSGTIRPAVTYEVSVRWLDADGGFIGYNQVPGYLTVPDEGGVFGELFVTNGGASGLTWVGVEPPPSPGPFTSWLNPETGDYYEWI